MRGVVAHLSGVAFSECLDLCCLFSSVVFYDVFKCQNLGVRDVDLVVEGFSRHPPLIFLGFLRLPL